MRYIAAMSVRPLPTSAQPVRPDGETSAGEREQALMLELRTLRAENEYLRQRLAQQPQPGAAANAQGSGLLVNLPLALPPSSAVEAERPPDTGLAPLEYEALFGALAKVFPIGVFRTNEVGLLTHVDGQVQQIFGLRREDFPQFGWLARVHPDDTERVQAAWVQAISRGEGLSLEFRLLKPGDELVHVLVRNTPMRSADGRVFSQLGFVQDITSLRTLEAEARLKDELNRQIIASSPDCTKVLDLEGRVLQMTERGCLLVEVDHFEQVHLSEWASWWPDEGGTLARNAVADGRQGKASRFVAFGHTFKGTPKWWDTVLTPICDAQGRPVMLLAVSRDISELYQQQDEIRRLNLDLENRVKERTEELAEAKERVSMALAEAQSLYNQAPCGYHSLNAEGLVVLMNRTELDWLGYERDEVIGRLHLHDLLRAEDVKEGMARLARLVAGDKPDPIEVVVRRRDGSSFAALLSSTAVRDSKGRFLRANNTLVDITALKAAQQALAAQSRFMQTITDRVPGLIAYLDAELHFRFANAEHQRVYGMDPKRIVGEHIGHCVQADIWRDIEPRLQAALAGQAQRFETWRRMVDGTPIFVSTDYLPDVDDQGRVRGIFVQIIDITDRKRVEERVSNLNEELEQRIQERSAELLEAEQRFRLMVDNLRDYCIFFMDANGLISDWTDSAQRMDGYSPVQMLGRHYGVLFDPMDEAAGRADAERMLRLAASRGQHDVQSWHLRKDGSRYWAHSVLIALRDQRGDLQGFAKVNRDMTDAKQLDDLMRNINDELEKRVVERTEQLLAANRDLESFSYSVSHDLRSPLRHISSFVSLLDEHLGAQRDEVTTRYLSTIGNSARHMSQLIDGLLAFSRLGRAAVNIAPVDFNQLVGAVVAQIAHDTDGRVVDWRIAPDLPLVHGDALLLREVWANLLGNAFKYTRPRERAVVEVDWQLDPVRGYTFTVRDNGVGFDTKYAEKLFGVFQRLHRASEFEGTGIGLALTRRIVERHGGSIWAESRLGQGSEFHFSLPIDGPRPSDSTDSMPAPLES